MREPGYIDLSKPVVYEFQDLTTGDVLVFDKHDDAKRQVERSDPKHTCRIVARNAEIDDHEYDYTRDPINQPESMR